MVFMAYMYMYFGAPGCGKSTHAVRSCRRSIKKGVKVYSNFPIKGAFRLDLNLIGVRDFSNSLLIIDEAGLAYNNREFKSFPRPALEFFKLHRHYQTSVVYYSQGWDDCDKKIRTLCSKWYNMVKLGPFTLIREFRRRVDIDDNTKTIADLFYKQGIVKGGLGFLYRPIYYKYFDSWEAPALRPNDDRLWYPEVVETPKQDDVA